MITLKISSIPIFLLLFVSFACTPPDSEESGSKAYISSPEAQGISSQSILEFVEELDRELPDQLHSIMLRRHGKVVASGWWAPYDAESPHMLYSLSKSFTSSAIGLAVEEGLISLDDQVISFFPNDLPAEPSDHLKAMRIRDLLRMNTGHEREPGGALRMEGSWIKGFLAHEVKFKPGTHFVYNSFATFMLSAIIQEVSGETLLDYLTPRLFDPMGIKNPTWESNPDGINTGGWGLSITTEDISRFGQLYLQKGRWEGKQLLPESWVEEATGMQTSNGSNPESDWDQGYGYQFWRCRHNLYRGDGAFGQYCIVMPDQDAVLAITSGTGDMQKVMNLAWEYLLPAMKADPLEENPEALLLLREKLEGLGINGISGTGDPAETGLKGGKYKILNKGPDGISAVSFDFEASPNTITFFGEEGEQTLQIGQEKWESGNFKNPPLVSPMVATMGGWLGPDSYRMRVIFTETPHLLDYTFTFKGKEMLMERQYNVSFGPTTLKTRNGILMD